MKVWIFVEGESDRIALDTLFSKWKELLGKAKWGLPIIPLDGKSHYLKKIGHRCAEKLINNAQDCVVGMPDLYPNSPYLDTQYKHEDLSELKHIQSKLVMDALINIYKTSETEVQNYLSRFHPTAFKHDGEMLLLASKEALRLVLATKDKLGNWRHPVEDQNQTRPPKYIIEELFRTKKGISYRETVHTKSVLEKITDMKSILFNPSNQCECPAFRDMLDWISSKTGVAAY